MQTLDIEAIKEILPHRYPFLLVDRIKELEPGKHAIGLKNVSANEAFFQGHFPQRAVMPGVLIVEAMAQVGGIMMLCMPEHRGKMAYIGGIEGTRFRKPVVPGDCLIMQADILRVRGNIGKVNCTARVDDQIVTEAVITFALVGS